MEKDFKQGDSQARSLELTDWFRIRQGQREDPIIRSKYKYIMNKLREKGLNKEELKYLVLGGPKEQKKYVIIEKAFRKMLDFLDFRRDYKYLKPQIKLIDKLIDSHLKDPQRSLLAQDVYTNLVRIFSEISSFFDQSGRLKSEKAYKAELNKEVGFEVNTNDPFKMGEPFFNEKITRLYKYINKEIKIKDSQLFEYITIILKYHYPVCCKTATPDKIKNRCYRQPVPK